MSNTRTVPVPIDRPTLLRLAAEADADPRTVLAELRAHFGRGRPVRGRAGERVRACLVRHGLVSAEEARPT